MKLLSVHAHFDDFEFVAAGTFELFRRKFGRDLRARVLVCTDGAAGHHFRSRKETAAMRLREQRDAAAIGKLEIELLRLPNGQPPREGFQVSIDLLAALWKAIRDFEPDYLFCPPLAPDALAGIHNDHVTVAEAVRRVAYLINVPHAFTPEYPADETKSEPCRLPVILTVYDGYMFCAGAYDLAVDVEKVFPLIAEVTGRHRSQIEEWIPWVGRHKMPAPKSAEAWSAILRERFKRQNQQLGIESKRAFETFTVTAWGEIPTLAQLRTDFPAIDRKFSHLRRLGDRLKLWSH